MNMQSSNRQQDVAEEDKLGEHYAVVYAPKLGRKKQRFPSNVVTIYPTGEEAVAAADEDKKLRAAEVYGPSRSSEGMMLYYLSRWL
ncbi:MAG: hypothetical protein OQK78_11965 [Gammaproteobacteria bacterium]|nr:hypothetical protein [Gammaproteobacteria bacterium]